MKKEKLREQILAYLSKRNKDGFKSRQLGKVFRITGDREFQELRGVLHAMVDGGELNWTKQRGYHMAASSNRIKGIVKIDKRGNGIVATIHGDVAIDKQSLHTAFNGDTVEVAVFVKKKSKKDEAALNAGEVLSVVSRAHTQFGGTLQKSKNFYFVLPDDSTVKRDFYVAQEDLNGAESGDKVLVELLE